VPGISSFCLRPNLKCTKGLECLVMHLLGPQLVVSPRQAFPHSTKGVRKSLSILLQLMRSHTGNGKGLSLFFASMDFRIASQPAQEKSLCDR